MSTNIKYIIREVPPEQTELSHYFDDDGLTEAGGDYCYNLFIVAQSHRATGFNEKAYKRVYDEIELLSEEWENYKYAIANGHEPNYKNFSDIVAWNAHDSRGGLYVHSLKNTNKLSKLRKFIERLYEPSQLHGHRNRFNWDADEEGCVAEYLTIATGKEWAVDEAHGYCQGDYVKMVYCKEHYRSGVKRHGEVWLGCAKEFSITHLKEKIKSENFVVWGYIISDSEARTDEDYKRLVCEWACIKEDETQLEMIEDSHTCTKYTYRIA